MFNWERGILKVSLQYDAYLKEHIANVYNGYLWIINHIKSEDIDKVLPEINWSSLMLRLKAHDASKFGSDEYSAYDSYFYGNDGKGDRSEESKRDFDYAWLSHIHSNPHHWQYWVLAEDDPENGVNGRRFKPLDIPNEFIFEMICDWWTFSWRTGDLYEIFNWWNQHRDKVIMSNSTMEKVEKILELLRNALKEAKQIEGGPGPLFAGVG